VVNHEHVLTQANTSLPVGFLTDQPISHTDYVCPVRIMFPTEANPTYLDFTIYAPSIIDPVTGVVSRATALFRLADVLSISNFQARWLSSSTVIGTVSPDSTVAQFTAVNARVDEAMLTEANHWEQLNTVILPNNVYSPLSTLSAFVTQLAPIANPTFTGTVSGISALMVNAYTQIETNDLLATKASNTALTDGLALKVNLTTFNALQTSVNLTRTFGWTDNSGTQAVANLYISKVGNQVQAIVSAFRVNAGNTSRSFVSHTVALPAEYIPSQNQYGSTFMQANTGQSLPAG